MQLKQATRGAEEPRALGIYSTSQAQGSLIPWPINHQFTGTAVPNPHPHLHHPPVYPGIHLQPVAPDAHLIRNHPAKQTHLETRQAQDIRLESAHYGPPRLVSGHRCDAEILELNTEEDGEGIVDEELGPDCAVVDGR